MGLRRIGSAVADATKGFAANLLTDQFLSYYRSGEMNNNILMSLGQKVERNRPLMSGASTPNYIADGSVFDVQVGQCAIVLANGAVREVVNAGPGAEDLAGQYTFETGTAPTIFGDKGFAASVKSVLSEAITRIQFGGQVHHTHQIVYFNMHRLCGVKFGVGDVRFKDWNTGVSMNLGVSGTATLQVANPLLLFKTAIHNTKRDFRLDDSEGQAFISNIKEPIKTRIRASFGSFQTLKDYNEIQSNELLLSNSIKEMLDPELIEDWGVSIFKVLGAQAVADEKSLERFERAEMGGNANEMRGMMAGASARAMETAAGNTGGSMLGFMGMNMAGMTGNNMMGGLPPVPPHPSQGYPQGQGGYPPQQGGYPPQGQGGYPPQGQGGYPPQGQGGYPPQQGGYPPQGQQSTPVATGWTCACGTTNSGKFCQSCGKQEPAPTPTPTPTGWTCACGTANTGKFCQNCGQKEPAPVSTGWTCTCGTVNTGKFCQSCGQKEPSPTPAGWTCSCGTANTGKFCQNCGKQEAAAMASPTPAPAAPVSPAAPATPPPVPAAPEVKCARCGHIRPSGSNMKFCPKCATPFVV